MKISDILSTDVIAVKLDTTDKDDAINKVIDLAAKSGKILDKEKSFQDKFLNAKSLFQQALAKALPFPTARQIPSVM